MLDALLAAAVAGALVAVGVGLLYAVTVVPFLLVVALAERRQLSTGRWAAVGLAAVLVGLALALLAWRAGAGPWLGLPLALGFAPALGLHLDRGRAGRHERPV